MRNGGLDSITALPIDGPSREELELFHDFFSANQASQVYIVPKRLAFDSTYSPLLLQQAYADTATCYSCLAMAATYSAIHGRDIRVPDKQLSAIYEAALRALRMQLIREKTKPRMTTIAAAINLIMAQAVGMCDKEALHTHRAGIGSFVEAWGGLHNLEPQLVALMLWTDYWTTLFTGIPPLFAQQINSMEIELERPPPQECGHAFEEPRMQSMIGAMLLENCRITCRLVELVEDKVNNTSTPSRWHYWAYKRDRLATRNAVVHAELFGSGTRSECIGLALNLVLILTLRMVPWKSPANELCDQLKTALPASGAHESFWKADIDVLLYVLYVLSAAGVHWDHRDWALDLLQRTLEEKYGQVPAKWPGNWVEQEIFNLKRFAWSEVLLGSSFHDICHELRLTKQYDLIAGVNEAGLEDEECGVADDRNSTESS